MTSITINGSPATRAQFSVGRLADEAGKSEKALRSALNRAKDAPQVTDSRLGALVSSEHPTIGTWLTKAGHASPLELHSIDHAATTLSLPESMLQQAVDGTRALAYGERNQPLYALSDFTSSSAVRSAQRTRAGADMALRALKVAAPVAIGAAAVTVASLRLADGLGSKLDTTHNINSRREGALFAAGGMSLAAGLAVGRMAQTVPLTQSTLSHVISRGAYGVALGGAIIGAVGIMALRADSSAPAHATPHGAVS